MRFVPTCELETVGFNGGQWDIADLTGLDASTNCALAAMSIPLSPAARERAVAERELEDFLKS